MFSIAIPVLLTISSINASPVQHHSASPRGLLSSLTNAVNNVASRASNAVHTAAAQASDAGSGAVSSAAPDLGILNPNLLPPASVLTNGNPFGNAALWQEAESFDKEKGNGAHPNRITYQALAYYQTLENSSHSFLSNALAGSSSISKGLQYLHSYPTQFSQSQSADPASSLVQLSTTPQQTIKSFGASGAWWPNFLKDFPPAQQKNLSTMLFSDDGLHLSGYRYNLGASGDKDNATVSTPGREVESFMLTNGSYDWLRDGPGYYYLQAAKEANVSSLTAFINSIPSALTVNKRPCGNDLQAQAIAPLAGYIATVMSHFAENGIYIEYVSPMNEPDNNFDSCNQEGMSVGASMRAEVFQYLRSALQASKPASVQKIKMIGDETSQIASQAQIEYGSWLNLALSSKSLDAIAVHMYDWPDDATLLNYRQLVINSSLPSPPPPIKMTEISTFTTASGVHAPWGWTGPKIMGPEYDPSINSALDMARYIWQWLTLVNAESWDWWTAVSNMMPCSPSKTPDCASTYSNDATPPGYNDGLIYIDPHYATTKDYIFYLTKRFWVFRHFTKFIRPGAVRYDIPNEVLPYGTVAIAAKNTDDVYSTIFINRNTTAQAIKMKLPGSGAKVTASIQTTDKDDFQSIPLPVVAADDTFKLTLPARGVLSIQFTVESTTAGVSTSKRQSEDASNYVSSERKPK